jgi:DNA adenine methylase
MGFGSSVTRPNRDGRPQRTGFRSNSNRSSTTPAHDWSNYPEQIDAFTARLRGVVIENRDAIEVMRQHDSPDTLHYVDPPYPHSTREPAAGGSHRGYRHEMSDAQHETLAAELLNLEGMVVLSTYPSTLYERLFSTWSRVERDSHADGAAARREVLYLNHAAAARQRQQQVPLGACA